MYCMTNAGGGGSSSSSNYAYAQVEFPSGSTCTATNGSTTLTAPITTGLYVFELPTPSNTPESWTFACTDGTKTNSQSISVTGKYQVDSLKLSYTRLPEGYQEIEYLQSDGQAYIRTLHSYISYTEQIEIDFMMLNNLNRGVFGFSYGTQMSHGLGNRNGLYYCYLQKKNNMETEVATYSSNATLNTKMSAIFNNSSHNIRENNTTISSAALKEPALNITQITARLPLFCQWDYSGSYTFNANGTERIYKFILLKI